jgi:hypothetical protein
MDGIALGLMAGTYRVLKHLHVYMLGITNSVIGLQVGANG